MQKQVLTSAGRSFHHSGAKTEKSCDLAVGPLLALRDGASRPTGTSQPGQGSCVEGSSRGVGSDKCLEVGWVVPLTALWVSTIVLNLMQAATGSQGRSRKRGVTWENFGRLNTSRAAAFWMCCKGLIAEAGSPARSELQLSRREMMSASNKNCAASLLRKGRIRRMLQRANLVFRKAAEEGIHLIEEVAEGAR